jgi:hypothetical protein
MLAQNLDGRLGQENVDAALNGILGDGVVGRVGSEYGNGIARGKGVNGGLVGVRINLVVSWE